jgi:hypothetical protein
VLVRGGPGYLVDPGRRVDLELAEDDVGADVLFLAVADGPQVDDRLHVAPVALDFEELLAGQRDVLDGRLRVGGPEQVLAVEVLLGLDLRRVGEQSRTAPFSRGPAVAGYRWLEFARRRVASGA